MARAKTRVRRTPPEELDFSHLETEDDEPVHPFATDETLLLSEAIYASWPFPDKKFFLSCNVGLFSDTEPVLVPDAMLTVGVEHYDVDLSDPTKKGRAFFTRLYGKAPDVVIEIVCDDEGGEEEKLAAYARLGVRYAVLHDPAGFLSLRPLRGFVLHPDGTARESRARKVFYMPRVGLGVTLWHGVFKKSELTWLRWCDRQGKVLPTGDEMVAQLRGEQAELLALLQSKGGGHAT